MAGELRVDTEVLARAGSTLASIGHDLSGVAATAGLRTALGHDGLGDTVDRFARGWDDARAATVRVVGELGEACRHVADTFDGIDDDLAARLREAFS
ncbi:hypothetical protein [Cellulomonas sp. S1-8]|uniref:hypothetical protein n=1 Tax=Cellulomonas sp. S1-8 TaxID=2904790 RepID=UPI0022437321|nr:hypothetical protein [Cellulomonas sp. S1-8]UZN02687.1 hypothetical protein OKX07_16765 [Cellulomonas sp. S1-8]